MADIFSKQKRSEVMSLIRSRGTKIEKIFLNGLRKNKLKGYRINPKMYSNPDFIFGRHKIAIFCDGDFWHGKDYALLKLKLKNQYWVDKIEKNMARDAKYNQILKKDGWIVLRFWESQIKKDVNPCLESVKSSIRKRKKHDSPFSG